MRIDLHCTRCLRIVSEADPDVCFKHSEVVSCGSCNPDLLFPPTPMPKRRTTTLSTARRYVQRYGGQIVGNSIDKPLKLYRGSRQTGYFLVAIVPAIF